MGARYIHIDLNMKKFPFYFQHDARDCGPTCLRMIASFYGQTYSIEFLREMTHISKMGVSMLGISETAENIGFRTIGARLTFNKLENIPLPCIVYWNQNHFIVVYHIERKKNNVYIYVADPVAGKLKYTEEEFCNCWINGHRNEKGDGLVLLLEPTPDFYNKKEGKQHSSKKIQFLISYIKPYKNLILQLLLGLTLGSILQLAFPFLTQSIVDIGIKKSNINFIYLVLVAQLVLTLSSASIEFIRGWILLHLGTRINIALISDFLLKLMKLPVGYFDTKMTGDILQRIGDHDRIQEFLTNSSLNILFSLFNVLIFSIVLCWYNLTIFFIFIFGSFLYFLWVNIFMKKRADLDHKKFSQQSANQSNVVQLIHGMQEIRLNSSERQKRWEWENIQTKLFDLRIKSLTLGQYQDSGAIIINQSKNIFITFLVAKFVIEEQMTLGMMLSVQYIIGQLNGPIDQLINFLRQTQDAKLSLERLSEIHSKEDEEDPKNKPIINIPTNKDLILNDISFSYDKTIVGDKIIRNINVIIPSGKQTAIVGTSGSGKTTLIKLLLRFYPIDKGLILLGENNLSSYSYNEWRKKCGVVMQDGFIFSDTIARNIAPGAETIDKDKLLNAVITANIKSFIEALPLSYNTKIGAEGHGLSQGQKQRILIARAVYKDPEFVFFDEATNALDANNERIIMDNLQIFFKNRTSVIIAHRLSTVRNADQIVVMEQGSIVEIGTHSQLTDKKGAYYNLVKNQLEL